MLTVEDVDGWGFAGAKWASFLLPCRYFVQSLGSQSTYCLRRSLQSRPPAARSTPPPPNKAASAPSGAPAFQRSAQPPASVSGTAPASARETWPQAEVAVEGFALGHVETNYGSSFPNGWIYIQGLRPGGVSVLVTGGEFGIGPAAPLTYIVAVRGPGLRLDFRTTDMSMVQVSFSCQQRLVRLVARGALRSLSDSLRLPPPHPPFPLTSLLARALRSLGSLVSL